MIEIPSGLHKDVVSLAFLLGVMAVVIIWFAVYSVMKLYQGQR